MVCFESGTQKSCSMIPAKSWDRRFKSALIKAFKIAEYNQCGMVDGTSCTGSCRGGIRNKTPVCCQTGAFDR
jgi:hypothetical protein